MFVDLALIAQLLLLCSLFLYAIVLITLNQLHRIRNVSVPIPLL